MEDPKDTRTANWPAERATGERTVRKITRRIAMRQAIGEGWDGAANDNQPWPMAKALLAEGNKDLLKYAMAYKKIEASANSEATLGGSGVSLGGGMQLDRHVVIREDGSIATKHVRQSTAANVDIPGKRKVRPFPDPETGVDRNTVRVQKPWSGDDKVNDMIDNKAILHFIQDKLGPLVEPFEMACIDGKTYEEVGRFMGVGNRTGATGAASAMVHMALITVRDALSGLRRLGVAA